MPFNYWVNLIVHRAFDHNGDGSISRDELLDAMRRFGHSFSEAECDEMFTQVSLATSSVNSTIGSHPFCGKVLKADVNFILPPNIMT